MIFKIKSFFSINLLMINLLFILQIIYEKLIK
jgi:hypothetical protein